MGLININRVVLVTIAMGVIICGVSACSTFTTTSEFPSTDKPISGIPYYLPLGRIHIVGSTTAPATDNTPAEDATPAGSTDSTSDVTATQKAKKNASTQDAASGKKAEVQYNIVITTVLAADPSALFYLKRNADYLFDDKITLSINSKYLLSSSSADSKDETATIISNIVSDVALMRTVTVSASPFDVTFDPENPEELKIAAEKISDSHLNLQVINSKGVDLVGQKATNADTKDNMDREQSSSSVQNFNGVAFRLPTAYTIRVTSGKNTTPTISSVQTAILPEKKQNYFLDATRMPFSEKTTQLTFTDGMLTTFSQNVPSPILGFIGIPKDIITAILPIPVPASPATGTVSTAAKK